MVEAEKSVYKEKVQAQVAQVHMIKFLDNLNKKKMTKDDINSECRVKAAGERPVQPSWETLPWKCRGSSFMLRPW